LHLFAVRYRDVAGLGFRAHALFLKTQVGWATVAIVFTLVLRLVGAKPHHSRCCIAAKSAPQ
jgi:hypothetical protein